MMRLLSCMAVFLCFASVLSLVPNQQHSGVELVLLSGTVIRESGSALEGVEVHLIRGGSIYQTTVTDKEGKFRFEMPRGKYELMFRYPGYVETVLKGLDIWKQPIEALRVLLPKLTLERDLEIIGPKWAPSPALQLSFRPGVPLRVGRQITGTLLLKNVGKEPILVPRELYTQGSQYSPEAKIMQISISLEGYNALYDQKYICLPSKNCFELAPSHTVLFPVAIYDRKEYDEGKRNIQVFHKKGANKLKINLHFVLPGSDDARTKPVEKEFTLFVRP